MARTLYEDYATATGQYTPSASVNDFTLLIEIADLPAEWKAAVASSGADVRVHDNFNNELPHDLIEWNYVSPTNVTGWIRCKYEGELDVAPVVKVYAGDANATAYAVDYGKGQYAAYDLAYYFPMSDDNDRTANPINIATNKGVAATGKIGGGLDYDPAGPSFSNIATSKLSVSGGTISVWFKTETSVVSGFIFGAAGAGVERTYLYTQYYSSAQHLTLGLGNNSSVINVTIADTDGIWNHAAMTWDGTNAKLFLNGTQVGSTTAYSGLTAIQDPGYIGHLSNGNEIDAVLDELILAPADLSSAWVDFEYKQTNNNTDFWDSSWSWVPAPAAGVSSGTVLWTGCAF